MLEVKEALAQAVKDCFSQSADIELSRPDEKFGDYASNVALQLAARLNRPAGELAGELAEKLRQTGLFADVQTAGPGFINLRLTDKQLLAQANQEPARSLAGQLILVEFGDPNPFKEMHIGHLYSYIAGDSICRLLETAGATVQRLSYHGDVGLHVAKAIWGLQKSSGQEIGVAYAAGAQAYEQDQAARSQIDEINQQIYQKTDQQINALYEAGRVKSFDYFDKILAQIGVKNDKRYLESQSTPVGVEYVTKNIGPVFQKSDGAIIFDGEKQGLHTRVFITSKGLPTYEAKDLGLAELKKQDYPNANRSIIITAHEQTEYFKVMLAALAQIDEPLAKATRHLSHGFVSLSTGKMSSRTGDVYSAADLLLDVETAAQKQFPGSAAKTELAAIKYGLLKHRLGSDIIYDVNEAMSLEGNSGPYLQYAHARACSLLTKAAATPATPNQLDADERSLARKVSEYPEVIEKATVELMPHQVCNYLYELAQSFNRFYEKCRIIGDEREAERLALVNAYRQVLAGGLNILGIEAPEKI